MNSSVYTLESGISYYEHPAGVPTGEIGMGVGGHYPGIEDIFVIVYTNAAGGEIEVTVRESSFDREPQIPEDIMSIAAHKFAAMAELPDVTSIEASGWCVNLKKSVLTP